MKTALGLALTATISMTSLLVSSVCHAEILFQNGQIETFGYNDPDICCGSKTADLFYAEGVIDDFVIEPVNPLTTLSWIIFDGQPSLDQNPNGAKELASGVAAPVSVTTLMGTHAYNDNQELTLDEFAVPGVAVAGRNLWLFLYDGGSAYNAQWVYAADPVTNGIRNSSDGGTEFAAGSYFEILGSPAVPEPAAWSLMLVGFGATGGYLRRRRGAVLA